MVSVVCVLKVFTCACMYVSMWVNAEFVCAQESQSAMGVCLSGPMGLRYVCVPVSLRDGAYATCTYVCLYAYHECMCVYVRVCLWVRVLHVHNCVKSCVLPCMRFTSEVNAWS